MNQGGWTFPLDLGPKSVTSPGAKGPQWLLMTPTHTSSGPLEGIDTGPTEAGSGELCPASDLQVPQAPLARTLQCPCSVLLTGPGMELSPCLSLGSRPPA